MHNMVQQELSPVQFKDLRQPVMEPGVIGVAQHRCYRRNLSKVNQDLRQPDIAGMQNMIHPREQRPYLWIKVVVGIRYDADLHAAQGASLYPFASSGAGVSSPLGSSTGSSSACFSVADSEASVNFIAPANRPVNKPPLIKVFQKNSSVGG